MPSQLSGYIKLTKALDTSCNIDVCEDSRMMRDSDSAYSNRVTMFWISSALNKLYRSVLRDSGNSLAASLLAYKRSSLMHTSTCVLEVTGAGHSAHRLTTYLQMSVPHSAGILVIISYRSRGCQIPILGPDGGTRWTEPFVIGTTTAFSHSFQNPVKEASFPRIPYARGIHNPVSPSVNPSILDAAPCRTGRRRSAMRLIFSSVARIASSSISLCSGSFTTPGNRANSLLSLARSMANLERM
jgi:hypothetical protein